MEQIKTHNIFLDTSIFIKENFFAGKKLNAFFKHAKSSEIELFTTEITVKECISNLEKFSSEAHTILKRALKEIDSKSKIFKNIKSLEDLFNLDVSFQYESEIENLKKKFSEQIKNNFKFVQIDSNVTYKVFDDYFNSSPPFKDGKKKSEFPDSFVLNSLESWCKKNNELMYIIAEDEDLISYKSEYLIPIKEYDKLLNQISFTFSDANMLPKVQELIDNKEDEILNKIKEEFTNEFPWDGFDNNQGYEYDAHGLETIDAFIDYHSVLYFSNNTASVELDVQIKYTVDVTYEDTSMAWYDKEDDRWYNTENVNEKVEGKAKLKVMIEVAIELPGKSVEWEEWEFKEISSGIPSNIELK